MCVCHVPLSLAFRNIFQLPVRYLYFYVQPAIFTQDVQHQIRLPPTTHPLIPYLTNGITICPMTKRGHESYPRKLTPPHQVSNTIYL